MKDAAKYQYDEFMIMGRVAGFTDEQLEFMWGYLAQASHTHDEYRKIYQ